LSGRVERHISDKSARDRSCCALDAAVTASGLFVDDVCRQRARGPELRLIRLGNGIPLEVLDLEPGLVAAVIEEPEADRRKFLADGRRHFPDVPKRDHKIQHPRPVALLPVDRLDRFVQRLQIALFGLGRQAGPSEKSHRLLGLIVLQRQYELPALERGHEQAVQFLQRAFAMRWGLHPQPHHGTKELSFVLGCGRNLG